MRRIVPLAVLTALLLPAASAPQPRAEPFVPVGVWYGGGTARPPIVSREPARERDAWRQDLRTIRSLGFNSIRNWVNWASAEPQRGQYDFSALDQLLMLATQSGVKVIVQAFTDSAPSWVEQRYPDSRVVSDRAPRTGSQPVPGFCFDHPGVRADLAAFLSAVAVRAARHDSFYAIDVWSEPHTVHPASVSTSLAFCYCRHTQARFREWLQLKYGTLDALNKVWRRTYSTWEQAEAPRDGSTLAGPDAIDWKTFVAVKLREDLRLKADAAAPRRGRPVSSHSDVPAIMAGAPSGFGTPDDWWMSAVVDHYGTSIHPKRAPAWSPVHLAATLDVVRSASRAKGWWLAQLQAGPGSRGAAPVTAADVRLWGWAAISRGARAISYYTWHDANGGGLLDPGGTVGERAKAAGEFAGIVGRNPGLFGALRPRPSRIAIVYDPVSYLAGGTTAAPGATPADSTLAFYRAMFERNMQADFIHADDVLAEGAWRYRGVYVPDPTTLAQPVAAALDSYVRTGGTLIRRVQDVAVARIAPDVRIGGAPGVVEARFLESTDALLLIAINHSDAPQRVTMTFSPDTPEAIWQNLETGTSVNFVMGKAGPFLTHAFAPRDVLVLVIRKRLR